jgi:RND family efflux transporter MFP subunit
MKAQTAKRGADQNKEFAATCTRWSSSWRAFRAGRLSFYIAAGTVLMAGCRNEEKAATALTPVTVMVVEQSKRASEVRYSGNIMPRSLVNLAFRIGGYVEKVLTTPGSGHLIQEGDDVHKGEVLVSLRQADYAAKVQEARAQLSEAALNLNQANSQVQEGEAALRLAEANYNRARTLFEKQSLTRPDFDGAQAQLDTVRSRMDAARVLPKLARVKSDAAQAMLHEAELALDDSTLKAPMNGVVLKRLVEVGSLVGPGSPAFAIADISSVKIVFGAPDSLLPRLKKGTAMTVTTEAVPGKFRGVVTLISPAADVRSRVFDVELTVDNPGHRLKPGMVASVEVPGERVVQPLPAIPMAAIVQSTENPGSITVFVVDPRDSRPVAHSRSVKLGEPLGNLITVSEGLRAGEHVIVQGATLVRDGEPVEIVK